MNLEELKNWLAEFQTNWKRGILFLLVIIVGVILWAYLTSFVGEKAKIHATSEEKDIAKNENILENEESHEKENLKVQTLHEYFKTDFSKYLAANRKIVIRIFGDPSKSEDNKDYELEFRLHCDFESLTKFISVYLPPSTYPNTSNICKVLAEQILGICDSLSEGVKVAASRYDDRMTEIDDLKFTGRVYIYHDTYLSDDEKDELRLFYKQRNVDPRFRGANYISKRFLYK